MHIVHGTWLPDDEQGFVQKGSFCLWVETDTPQEGVHRRAGAVHPRQLTQTVLVTFLIEKLGMQEFAPAVLEQALCMKYFLLPTVEGRPAPSFELLRYMEEDEPITFDLQPWQICCYVVPDVIALLNNIHFVALNAAEDFQMGADLLFWYQYTQVFKGVL